MFADLGAASTGALRLAATKVEAGLMGESEAAELWARLRAWKPAHVTEPAEG